MGSKPNTNLPTNVNGSFGYPFPFDEDNFRQDPDFILTGDKESAIYSNVAIKPENTENLPFRIIHPTNFDQPFNNAAYQKSNDNESNNPESIQENINNFNVINEPLKFEDFNVVDALMAEPEIWRQIEENVSAGDHDFNEITISDSIQNHNQFDQNHFEQLFRPDSKSENLNKENDEAVPDVFLEHTTSDRDTFPGSTASHIQIKEPKETDDISSRNFRWVNILKFIFISNQCLNINLILISSFSS